jgi:hypothetical protein
MKSVIIIITIIISMSSIAFELNYTSVDYEPTVVSLKGTNKLFSAMRSKKEFRKGSQCYNRAHVWTYEMAQRFGLNSLKIYIFFSAPYREEYGRKAKWWFHVAPAVMALDAKTGQKKVMVLDKVFFNRPAEVREWTDRFMLNDYKCEVVDDWYAYRNYQDIHDCFIIVKSMYFWQPLDIKKLANGELAPESFGNWRIERAYKNGVKRRYRPDRDE